MSATERPLSASARGMDVSPGFRLESDEEDTLVVA
jgi:hypothetical protein